MASSKREKRFREAAEKLGAEIQGRYRLVRVLGNGGMGAVYKAADSVLRRFVAIKLLHASAAQNPASVERFVREARASASIGHPNIIDILDFGSQEGRPFLVMEYLRGRSLSETLALEETFTMRRACSIATHALAGLSAAHGRGIIHRDLKPANLMLISYMGDDDFVKLCDFGFAALTSHSERYGGDDITPERTLVGTPAYAAPERLRGDNSRDPRLDVYAIGVVLYEMLSGRRPFAGSSFKELTKRIRKEAPMRLRKIRPEIPKRLEEAILTALEKDKENRYPDAESFAAALVPFGGRFLPKDEPTDSFTMNLLQIRARKSLFEDENLDQGLSPEDAKKLLSLQLETKREKNKEKKSPEGSDGLTRRIRVGPKNEIIDATKPKDVVDQEASLPSIILVAVREMLRERYGEDRWVDFESSFPHESAVFDVAERSEGNVLVRKLSEVLERIDNHFGNDDMSCFVECGRTAGESIFHLIDERDRANCEVLVKQLPHISLSLFEGIRVYILRTGKGFATLSVVSSESGLLPITVFFLGVIEATLKSAGAKEVEVTMAQAIALGDDSTQLELSWLNEKGPSPK